MSWIIYVKFKCGHYEEEGVLSHAEGVERQRTAEHYKCVRCMLDDAGIPGSQGGQQNAVC